MKILVIGSGGREHALVWKLRQSPRVSQVYCAPGNGGICRDAECVAADVKSLESLVAAAQRVRPDLTVVGPELPLSLGVVDEFSKRGWRTFGPTRAAAQLEASKTFAKEFMQRHRIPTAHYAVCTSPGEIKDALGHFHLPVVVKADGLAAGKGVVIARTKEEASAVAVDMLSGKMLGEAGSRVVLEECLKGEELSFLVVSDGERVAPLVAAQDYKRVGEGDTGPNTGGMGAYSTDDIIDAKMREWLVAHIARPVVEGMKSEGMEYCGVLYCGLMMTATGPVVVASGGYPGTFAAGKKIVGLEQASQRPSVKVFHAGTSYQDGTFYTTGGRVLGVTARADTLGEAVEGAYAAISGIGFEGMHYRKDIAARAVGK